MKKSRNYLKQTDYCETERKNEWKEKEGNQKSKAARKALKKIKKKLKNLL